MRTKITPHSVAVWLSARDTYDWATKPGANWPCSTFANKRVFAAFDSNGLVDFTINGRPGDCDGTEFSAICADSLADKTPAGHPCRFVVIDQFAA